MTCPDCEKADCTKTINMVCDEKFDRIHSALERIEESVRGLDAHVRNGLSDRTARTETRVQGIVWLLGLAIPGFASLAAYIIAQMP